MPRKGQRVQSDPGVDPHVMACMEVWGGNRAIDNGVIMPGLDAWVYSRPFLSRASEDGGGDLHYVTSCATGRITRLVVADVSGHGAPVSKAADALRRLMCRYSNYIDQTRFVMAVNERFGELAEETDGAMFATGVFATYFAPTDELSICNAGHPRPLLYTAKAGTWSRIDHVRSTARQKAPSNLPLGVLEPTEYPSASRRLRDGDLVLFYTDSLIESADGAGRQLGEAGLIETLAGLDTADPGTLIRRLRDRIIERAGRDADAAFADDVTALLIRRNALKPRPSLALAAAATGRILLQAIRSLRRGAMPAAFPQFNIASIGGAAAERYNAAARSGDDADRTGRRPDDA